MKPRSEAAASIFEAVTDLYASSIVNQDTVKEFAARCLVPEVPEYTPEQIRTMRKKAERQSKRVRLDAQRQYRSDSKVGARGETPQPFRPEIAAYS